jgi:hypothetical protein
LPILDLSNAAATNSAAAHWICELFWATAATISTTDWYQFISTAAIAANPNRRSAASKWIPVIFQSTTNATYAYTTKYGASSTPKDRTTTSSEIWGYG